MIKFNDFFRSIPIVYILYAIVLYIVTMGIRNLLMEKIGWGIGVLFWMLLAAFNTLWGIKLEEYVSATSVSEHITAYMFGTIPGNGFINLLMWMKYR